MTYLYNDGDIRRRIRVEDFFISLKNTFSFTEENLNYVRISSTSFNEIVDTFAKLILSNEVITIYKRHDEVV